MSAEGAGAFADFHAKQLAHEPELRLAALFAPALREPRARALAALRFELAEAAFAVRAAEVAQAKLGWWLGEADALAAGRPSHPIARALHEAAVDADAVRAAVAGAGAVARLESPESVDALLATVRRLGDPLGRLAGAAASDANDTARAAALVAGALRWWPRFALPERSRVPLALLARHAVNRAQLVEPAHAAAASALLRDLLHALDARLAAAAREPGADAALAGARRVLVAHLLRDVDRARAGRVGPLGLRALLASWRNGRALALEGGPGAWKSASRS